MTTPARLILAVSCGLALTPSLLAADIPVPPGEGTLDQAARSAAAGDILILQAGEYRGGAQLPAGVTLRGAGADKTTIHAGERFTLECLGPEVTIADVRLIGNADSLRAIGSDMSVRVEGCHIEGFQQGVALRQAPLSDIVNCTFSQCGIAVRAIGEACPTVWGCHFIGGTIGIFAMDGAPYVRHNLFEGVETGMLIITEHSPIVRNNVFLDCTKAGIEVRALENAFLGPSTRNNVFQGCGVALVCPSSLLTCVSHNLVHDSGNPPMRDDRGAALPEPASTLTIDPGISVEDHTLSVAAADALAGKGIRLNSEPDDAVGDIGLAHGDVVGPARQSPMPPVRFRREAPIANAVREEYQALAMWRVRSGGQSLQQGPGGYQDVFSVRGGDIAFDISRFFSESSLK